MITLVGVGHVFNISDQVRAIILERTPRVVCLELDPGRYEALLHPGSKRNAPVIYRILAQFQKRMAREFGGEVGQEMLTAAKAANEVGAEVLLIDADASAMFSKLWGEMPVKEKINLMFSSVAGLFISRDRVEKELEKFEENEEKYIEQIGEQFPTLKRVLIEERNRLMAARIESASQQYSDVLAVVGDGHIDGISRLLSHADVSVYRLRDLLGKEKNGPAEGSGSNAVADVHISYNYDETP